MSGQTNQDPGTGNQSSRIRRTAIIVPARESAYGKTPEWVEKSTKDFLDNLPSRNHLKSLNYTKPELRNRLKNQIMSGSKGGRPGQWSARKAQLLALAYRKAGGGYRGGPNKSQRSLKKWTKERWTTVDGKPALRRGKMSRYLPAAAWKRLSPQQRRATIAKKLAGDKRGKQFVSNTARAASASKKIRSRKAASHNSPETKSALDQNNEMRLSFEKPTIDASSMQPATMPDGSSVSIKPIIFQHQNMHVVVPTINEMGEILSDSEAIQKYLTSNWHLGKFGDIRAAERYVSLINDKHNSTQSKFTEVSDSDSPGNKRRHIDASAVRRELTNTQHGQSDALSSPKSSNRSAYMSLFGGS